MPAFDDLKELRLWAKLAVPAAILLVVVVQWLRARFSQPKQRSPELVEAIQSGHAAQSKGEFAEALKAYTRAIELDPDDTAALRFRAALRNQLNDHRGALGDVNRVLQLAPDDPDMLNMRGIEYYALGMYDDEPDAYEKAVRAYTAAIEASPKDAIVYANRGYSRRRLADFEGALEDFNTALQLDPDCDHARKGRAVAWAKLGDAARAMEDADYFFERSPRDANAFVERGYVKVAAGDMEGGYADFDEAARLEPNNPQRHNGIAWRRATAPNRGAYNPGLALAHARRACEMTQMRAAGFVDTLAAAFADAGEFGKAQQCQQHALSLLPAGARREKYEQRLALYAAGQPYREELD
jgi:tetratricopeptide (TPR) repeat protein